MASIIAIIENERPNSSAFTYFDKILFMTNARIEMNASNVLAMYIIEIVVASVCYNWNEKKIMKKTMTTNR